MRHPRAQKMINIKGSFPLLRLKLFLGIIIRKTYDFLIINNVISNFIKAVVFFEY